MVGAEVEYEDEVTRDGIRYLVGYSYCDWRRFFSRYYSI